MKFAHLSDCHIGGWREPELRKLGIDSFRRAIEICIEENVAFVLISGDLFDTALPQTELIKEVASILKMLTEYDISVYSIPGSHDFSPSGKTMMDVLENAGLVHNVVKFDENGKLQFTVDKTNVKITGLYGKRLGLEKFDYARLEKSNLENEKGFKIFMFHTALEEFKPLEMEKMEAYSYQDLPKNFDYYAGGHVHYIFDIKKENYGLITFPGPMFPNNFKELEELGCGGFYIIENDMKLRHVKVKLKETLNLKIDVNNLTSHEAEDLIINKLKTENIKDRIVLLRVYGVIKSGRVTDINFRKITSLAKESHCILKNTHKLSSKETEILESENYTSVKEIEENILNNHVLNVKYNDKEKDLLFVKEIMKFLEKEKDEGEKNTDFEKRVLKDAEKIMEL